MFNKKKCKNCGEKIDEKNKFCPNCGCRLGEEGKRNKDYGLLGKDDLIKKPDLFVNSLFSGFTGNMFNKLLGNTMKMFEKEIQKMQKD